MNNNSTMLQLCRLCLVKDNVNIPIFEGQGDISQIFQKISSCLPVKVTREDKLPQKICDGCSYKLDIVNDFRNTTVNAEKQLLTWLSDATSGSAAAAVAVTRQVETDVAQQIKPAETFVKQEAIDPSDVSKEEDDVKSYMFQDKFELPAESKTSENEDEPPPKRAKRTAAVKAAIALDNDSDEDDDDSGEPLTKVEDESDEGSDEDHSFVDIPSTSADDQPGPSGVNKDGGEAPSDDLQFIDDYDSTNIQCGMCSNIFPNKQLFVEHSMEVNGFYTCCRCQAKFRSCKRLSEHYDTHKSPRVTETHDDNSEVLLDFDGNEEIIVQPSVADGKEFVYILDDAACVNEVVIDEDDPMNTEVVMKHSINLEHGYVMQNDMDNYIEEEMEDEDGNIVIARRLVAPTATTSKRIFTQAKPRAPQPKRRHEVPDFSAANYVYMNPTNDIEIPHYKCLRCEQVFINKFVFFRHIEKGKCFINNCDVCTASFTKNSEFYDHYIAEHTDRAICNFCFRTFMYEKNVKEHMLRHLDQFRHRCEDCNKGFYTVREYRNHYKNRHMGIRHKCDVCGRSFADEYYFKRHIATHAKASKNVTAVMQINN